MTVEAIADALTAIGFRPSKPRNRGAYCFAGHIPCHGEAVPVEIEIEDLDFVKLPRIRVLKRPQKLSGFQPHFGEHEELCYANKSEVFFDRYCPAENVIGCLKKASQVLENLASKHPPKDTHEEFSAYWPGSWLLLDCPQNHRGAVRLEMLRTNGSQKLLLASPDEASSKRLIEIGWSKDTSQYGNCYILQSQAVAMVHGKIWPPKTLGDVLDWINEIDQSTYRKIEGQLANKWVLETGHAAFVIRSQNFIYGFRFPVDRTHRKTYSRKPVWYRDYLLRGNGRKIEVGLLTGFPFDPQYIYSRNLPDQVSLTDKTVMVVGCGTIGGYLATYLARLGAGDGARGKLILADPEFLMPGNTGRHVLGMGSLFQNKAEGVAVRIKQEFPHLNIAARPVDARAAKEVTEVDLLIDATGEEALSVALNERITQLRIHKKRAPAVLHIWISGAGSAIQSLFVDSLDTACYRCLRVEQNGELMERFSALKSDSNKPFIRVGCESYMPFPVSTSVQAAALGLEATLDWARGNPSYRLRTRVIDEKIGRNVKDQNPSPLSNCPACRKH